MKWLCEQNKTKQRCFPVFLFYCMLLWFLMLFYVFNDVFRCFTIWVRCATGSATSVKNRKNGKKEKGKSSSLLLFWNHTKLPGSRYASLAVYMFPPQWQCSAPTGTSAPQRSVLISRLFLVSRCHFVPLSVASSEPLTRVCTQSFRLSDSLATRLLSSAQLLTFLSRFVDAAPTFTPSENSAVNGPSCLRYVSFALCFLCVTRFMRLLVCAGEYVVSSLPPSWWRSCGRDHVVPLP